MPNVQHSLNDLMGLDGVMCCAVVDSTSGMILGQAGAGLDMEVAAAGNTEIIRSKIKTMKALGQSDNIEDILITLGKQYHIIRPCENNEGLFLYCILDKSRANLAMARRKCLDIDKSLTV
jgi:hypothetical protein